MLMLTKQSYYFLIAVLLVFVVLTTLLFSGFLAPIIIGALLAALGARWYKRILNALNGRESPASFIMVSIMILLVVVPLILVVVFLSTEAFNLFIFAREEVNLNEIITAIETTLSKFNITIDVASLIKNQFLPAVQNFGLYLSQQLGAFLSNTARLVIGFFIAFITAYYLLKDGGRLGAFFIKVSPLKTADELFIFKTFKGVGEGLFLGVFSIALIQGIFGGLGFWLFGLGAPVIWGAMIMILGIIPLLGGSLVYVPATIYFLAIGKPGVAIGFLIYNILYVAITENVLKPKLISGQMRVHPFLVLISILGGIKIFGILGIIYGPLIVAIFIGLLNIYIETQKGKLAH